MFLLNICLNSESALDTLASYCLSPILMIAPPIIVESTFSANSTLLSPCFLIKLITSALNVSSKGAAVITVAVAILLCVLYKVIKLLAIKANKHSLF